MGLDAGDRPGGSRVAINAGQLGLASCVWASDGLEFWAKNYGLATCAKSQLPGELGVYRPDDGSRPDGLCGYEPDSKAGPP